MKHVHLWSLAIIVVLILGFAPQPAALRAAQIASPSGALSTPELIEAARAGGEIDQDRSISTWLTPWVITPSCRSGIAATCRGAVRSRCAAFKRP